MSDQMSRRLEVALYWAEEYRQDEKNNLSLSGHQRSVLRLADEVLKLRVEIQTLHSSGHCECEVCGPSIKPKKRLRKPKKCQGCKSAPSEKIHTCPYQEDMNGDSEFKCHCCDDCRHNCAMEI